MGEKLKNLFPIKNFLNLTSAIDVTQRNKQKSIRDLLSFQRDLGPRKGFLVFSENYTFLEKISK